MNAMTLTFIAAAAAASAFGGDVAATLTLADGSIIKGTVKTEKIEVESVLGTLAIPVASLRSAAFSQAATPKQEEAVVEPETAEADESLVYWCTFDSAEDIESPKIGPSGICAGKLGFMEGHKGNAMLIGAENENEPVAVKFPAGVLSFKEGMIECWIKVEDDRGPIPHDCNVPRIFNLYQCIPNFNNLDVCISRNNGLGYGGVCGKVGTQLYGTDFFRAPPYYRNIFRSTPDGWHHVSAIWKASGLPGGDKFVVFVDGRQQKVKFANAEPWNLDSTEFKLTVGSDFTCLNACPFAIDELKIWNKAKVRIAGESPIR